jgi:hypothetical protein
MIFVTMNCELMFSHTRTGNSLIVVFCEMHGWNHNYQQNQRIESTHVQTSNN